MATNRVQVLALSPVGYDGYQATGTVFPMVEADVKHYEDAGLVTRYAEPEAVESEVTSEGLEGEALLDKLAEAWGIDTPPAEYLEKFPTGPLAELAKRMIEVQTSLNK